MLRLDQREPIGLKVDRSRSTEHQAMNVSTPESLILWDVVEEHFDEAEFLYEQWRSSANSALYTLEELVSGPERRLEAHLDGLRVAGLPVIPRLVSPVLSDSQVEPARLTVALLTLLSVGESPASFRAVFAVLREESFERRQAAFQALLLTERSECSSLLASELDSLNPDILRLLARRGVDPGFSRVSSFLRSDDPRRIAAGLEVVSLFGYGESRPLVKSLLKANPMNLDGLRAGAVLGLSIVDSCLRLLSEAETPCEGCVLLLALEGQTHFQRSFRSNLEKSPLSTLWGLGFLGTIEAADVVLECCNNKSDAVARLAGEAFRAITGLDAEEDRYHRDPVEPTANETLPAFDEDDLDADLADDPLEELPLPQPQMYADFWAQNRKDYAVETRYINGEPQNVESLVQSLERVSTRRRHAIAFQLRMLTRGKVVVPTWMWGRQQVSL